MSYNETYWSHSTSATENEPMEQAHDNPGYPWWLEEVVGSVAAAVLLIICIIATFPTIIATNANTITLKISK